MYHSANRGEKTSNDDFDLRVRKVVSDYLKVDGFVQRKVTDLPVDALQVVSRKFVTLNGPSSTRPKGSVLGQSYYDTTIGKPIWWNGSTFKDAAGNTV